MACLQLLKRSPRIAFSVRNFAMTVDDVRPMQRHMMFQRKQGAISEETDPVEYKELKTRLDLIDEQMRFIETDTKLWKHRGVNKVKELLCRERVASGTSTTPIEISSTTAVNELNTLLYARHAMRYGDTWTLKNMSASQLAMSFLYPNLPVMAGKDAKHITTARIEVPLARRILVEEFRWGKSAMLEQLKMHEKALKAREIEQSRLRRKYEKEWSEKKYTENQPPEQ